MILLWREAYVTTPIRAALLEIVNRRTASRTNWAICRMFRPTRLVASIRKPRSTRAVQTVKKSKFISKISRIEQFIRRLTFSYYTKLSSDLHLQHLYIIQKISELSITIYTLKWVFFFTTQYPLNLLTRTYMVYRGENCLSVPEKVFWNDLIGAGFQYQYRFWYRVISSRI